MQIKNSRKKVLRKNHKTVTNLSKAKWAKLKPKDRWLRIRSLKVLGKMRDNVSLTKASKEVGLDFETIKQHLGRALFKRRKRWQVIKTDKIERQMQFYERGKIKSIVVTNSKDASIIGQYFNDVKKSLDTGNGETLEKYKKLELKDSKGKKHRLETRLDKIYEIEEAKEESEFREIYEV